MSNRNRKRGKVKDPEKEAAKRARREERKAREAAAAAAAARRRRIRQAVLAAIGLAAAVGVVFAGIRAFFPPELEGVIRQSSQGRDHIPVGQQVEYGTATPTSGPHVAAGVRCGVFNQPMPLDLAVHGLEHGVVVVWHRPDLAAEQLSALRSLIGEYSDRVILSPNPGIEEPIVATAWNRLKPYTEVNDDLRAFIDTYRNRGPERVPCDV